MQTLIGWSVLAVTGWLLFVPGFEPLGVVVLLVGLGVASSLFEAADID